MNDDRRNEAPNVEQIEARLTSVAVRGMRPLVRAGIRGVSLACRFRFVGHHAESLLQHETPLIFAANHVSHADTAAILACLPPSIRRCTAVAAALDVFGSSARGIHQPLRRELLQIVVAAGFRAYAFDRHGPPLRSIRTSVQLIRKGWSVVLYPEGTRSRTGEIGRFKAGVGLLSRFSDRPVCPVFVHGGGRILPCGAFLPRSGTVDVWFGKPMQCDRREPPDAFTERVRDAVIALADRHAGAGATTLSHREPDLAVSSEASNQPA